jgi:hypothetical protein
LCLYYVIHDEHVRFKVLTAASMMFRVVFWDILPCKMIVDRRFRGAYCLHFTQQYIPEDNSEHDEQLSKKQESSAVLSFFIPLMKRDK